MTGPVTVNNGTAVLPVAGAKNPANPERMVVEQYRGNAIEHEYFSEDHSANNARVVLGTAKGAVFPQVVWLPAV